jgi:hypothetical protein
MMRLLRTLEHDFGRAFSRSPDFRDAPVLAEVNWGEDTNYGCANLLFPARASL